MKRPWQVWLVFAVCVGVAAVAMAWLTRQALHADELRRAAEAQTELEQRVSLALWRMDTDLAPIIAGEVIRDPAMYRTSFFKVDQLDAAQQSASARNSTNLPPTQATAQTGQFDDLFGRPPQSAGPQAAPATATLLPSPLLVELPPYVICNFEATLDGQWRSPQVPEPGFVALAAANGVTMESMTERSARLAELSAAVDPQQLAARLPQADLPSLAEIGTNTVALANAESIKKFNDLNVKEGLNFYVGNGSTVTANPFGVAEQESRPSNNPPPVKGGGKVAVDQMAARAADFDERNRRYQNVAQQGILEQQRQFTANYAVNNPLPLLPMEGDAVQRVGVTRPVWVGERLLLARRIERGGKTLVQGCWLDWTRLRTRLLAQAVELVPDATLVPVSAQEAVDADPGRMLAGLPVRLVVGDSSALAGALSPTLRMALWIGWGAVGFATLAAAVLLGGVMMLSERRAAFVSSVTHELRTPLTTFRMYAEMLARGMVPDAERRHEYLQTLQREAERLSHLVENVLSYARLERGRKPNVSDRVTPDALLDRIGPRLAHRAHEAGMQCLIEIDAAAADVAFTTDQNIVEQILFNLVDNASKYARTAADQRIQVTCCRNNRWVEFAVRDHGPGIERNGQSPRIRPFAKTAERAAETAPGVGLGLALCRRLARQLGGRLEIAAANGGGASVSLILPIA